MRHLMMLMAPTTAVTISAGALTTVSATELVTTSLRGWGLQHHEMSLGNDSSEVDTQNDSNVGSPTNAANSSEVTSTTAVTTSAGERDDMAKSMGQPALAVIVMGVVCMAVQTHEST